MSWTPQKRLRDEPDDYPLRQILSPTDTRLAGKRRKGQGLNGRFDRMVDSMKVSLDVSKKLERPRSHSVDSSSVTVCEPTESLLDPQSRRPACFSILQKHSNNNISEPWEDTSSSSNSAPVELPPWLVDTFSTLDEANPLRLLLPESYHLAVNEVPKNSAQKHRGQCGNIQHQSPFRSPAPCFNPQLTDASFFSNCSTETQPAFDSRQNWDQAVYSVVRSPPDTAAPRNAEELLKTDYEFLPAPIEDNRNLNDSRTDEFIGSTFLPYTTPGPGSTYILSIEPEGNSHRQSIRDRSSRPGCGDVQSVNSSSSKSSSPETCYLDHYDSIHWSLSDSTTLPEDAAVPSSLNKTLPLADKTLQRVYFSSPTEDPSSELDPADGYVELPLDSFQWLPFDRKAFCGSISQGIDQSYVTPPGRETNFNAVELESNVLEGTASSPGASGTRALHQTSPEVSPRIATSVQTPDRQVDTPARFRFDVSHLEPGLCEEGPTSHSNDKSSAFFAPAPGIFLSPLQNQQTSPLSFDDFGKRLDSRSFEGYQIHQRHPFSNSQETNDSIKSWSE